MSNDPKDPKDLPDPFEAHTAAFNWFPGHMAKALKEIKQKISLVDVVLELRDARVPWASGNHALTAAIPGKARLILLNKTNMADPTARTVWENWFIKDGVPFLFINAIDKASTKQILTKARQIFETRRQASNADQELKPREHLKLMVIGLPNTGKSTLINQLSGRNAVKVADKPGETRQNLWVIADEKLHILDTPGIMPPEIALEEHRLWLSAINAIPDEIIGEESAARFLVKYFLKRKGPEFKERYKLENFDLSIEDTLLKIAKVRGCIQQKGVPDLDRVHKLILMDFRSGLLGKACFGLPPANPDMLR